MCQNVIRFCMNNIQAATGGQFQLILFSHINLNILGVFTFFKQQELIYEYYGNRSTSR